MITRTPAQSPNSSIYSDYLQSKDYWQRKSERRGSVGNVVSVGCKPLVSFDPKSSTLMRFQEHPNDSSDDELLVCSSSSRQEPFVAANPDHHQLSEHATPEASYEGGTS